VKIPVYSHSIYSTSLKESSDTLHTAPEPAAAAATATAVTTETGHYCVRVYSQVVIVSLCIPVVVAPPPQQQQQQSQVQQVIATRNT